jgi:hypothetical protein
VTFSPEVLGESEARFHKGPVASCRWRIDAGGRAAIRSIAEDVGRARCRRPLENRGLICGGLVAALLRRADMFEPLADVEKKSSGKTMRVIGIVMAVLALILLVVSFA